MEKIAVFLNNSDRVDHFYQCVKIRTYIYQTDGFQRDEDILFQGITPQTPRQIMADTTLIAKLVANCSVVAFKDISGIAYSVFDRMNFHIFSIDDDNEETLLGIHHDLSELVELKKRQTELQKEQIPHETETPGIYFFDMLKAQKADPELTSKKALKNFLDTTPFMELRVKGAHVPPWIKKDDRFTISEQEISGAVYMIVTRKSCF
ncbi:MAG: Fe-only nitrogenase accessory AnfO family protein [Lachnospiraceae bacterium]